MKHWMYLVDGGNLLINRVVISKLGITVRETTEYFSHGAGSLPTVGEPHQAASPAVNPR